MAKSVTPTIDPKVERQWLTIAESAGNPDVAIALHEDALNKFLSKHFDKNPEKYDRSRETHPNEPIYRKELNDHGTIRVVEFWAKVTKVPPADAIQIRLQESPPPAFEAWWKKRYGQKTLSASAKLPPNVVVTLTNVVLQINIPRLDDPTRPHKIDFPFSVEASCFASIKHNNKDEAELHLDSWNIVVSPNGDPFDPDNSAIWGPVPPGADPQLRELRALVRDAFTIGANVVLTDLGTNYTKTLPLPPIHAVDGVDVNPDELVVSGKQLVVSGSLKPAYFQDLVARDFQHEMYRFQNDMRDVDLYEILKKAPLDQSPEKIEQFFIKEIPAYAAIDSRYSALLARLEPANGDMRAVVPQPIPNADLVVMFSSNVVDVIAKEVLKADTRGCSDWVGVDVAVGSLEGRVCYWFSLKGAHGSVANTNIKMGCSVDAGGNLEIEACVGTPCTGEACLTWSPGIGLAGPCDITVTVSNADWNSNRCLKLKAHADKFPGLVIHGLPPGVDKLVNLLVNYVSSVVFKAFINAILYNLDFYLIKIDKDLPKANMSLKLDQFGVGNVQGLLAVSGRTTFS